MESIIKKFADVTNKFDYSTLEDNIGGAQATGDTLPDRIIGIVNIVIGVLGIVCVIVMIIGGINYMTSSGDSGKVKKAKDTILYGVIGLIICILAVAIINFVISSLVKN